MLTVVSYGYHTNGRNTTHAFSDRIVLRDFISKYTRINTALRDVYGKQWDDNLKKTSPYDKLLIVYEIS